jgi:uncharacterized repeat protein (TIGR01451 family)
MTMSCKQFLRKILALSLVVLGVFIIQLSSSRALARNQYQLATPSPGITVSPEQIGSAISPTLTLPNVDVKKGYKITSDLNANGSIDPGDKVMYTITLTNKGDSEATNLVIVDNPPAQYFEVIKNEDITKGGSYNGEAIQWKVDKLAVNAEISVSYSVTINKQLAFGTTEISNLVDVFTEDNLLAETKSKFTVIVPTPTPSPSPSPVPSETLSLTPGTPTDTPTPTPETGASALSTSWQALLAISIMAVLGMAAFFYVGAFASFKGSSTAEQISKLNDTRIHIFREGVIIIFIVSTVLLLAISKVLPSDGAISILSAIVGYVFGRASQPK